MHVFQLPENSQGHPGLTPPAHCALDELCLRGVV